MFTVEYRDRVRDWALQWAESDARVVAGAVVGSLAFGEGDRWSDLDLTFAVVDDAPLLEILDDWTQRLVTEFDAAHLFDVPSGTSLYRVLLLPGCLQFDLSFTPASSFGASGPKFRLLFGDAVTKPHVSPPAAKELFGHAVHHLLRARFCIERGRLWQAEYWISSARDCAPYLACLRRGLPANHGRGFDSLPAEVREQYTSGLVTSLKPDALLRALGCAVDRLIGEAGDARDLATKLEPQLRELTVA